MLMVSPRQAEALVGDLLTHPLTYRNSGNYDPEKLILLRQGQWLIPRVVVGVK